MAKTRILPGYGPVAETATKTRILPGYGPVAETAIAADPPVSGEADTEYIAVFRRTRCR